MISKCQIVLDKQKLKLTFFLQRETKNKLVLLKQTFQ